MSVRNNDSDTGKLANSIVCVQSPGAEKNLPGSVIGMSVDESSVASVYWFSSSRDGSAMLREAEGRIFNSQNELYYLPAGQYTFFSLMFTLSSDGALR